MKIFIIEPYTGTPGHFERWAVRTCEALAGLQNDVTLVTYGGISTESSKVACPFSVVKAASDGTEALDWRYHKGKIHLNSFRTFFRREMWEFRTFRLAASLARREELSIAHFHDADPILLALVINFMLRGRRMNNRPILVLAVHEIIRLNSSRGIKRRAYYWIYRRCLGRLIKHDLDAIVVLDPSLKQGLLSRFSLSKERADRIRVLPHGIGDPVEVSRREDACRRLNLDPSETIFLLFGILRKDKRIDLAIEAIKGLPRCRLVIAGEAHDLPEGTIKELILRNGCEESVSAEIAYLPEERMHDYFSACDAVIIPYDKSFKGLSGILTLACGHGKVTIASDVGVLGQTIRDHRLGFAIEPESATAIREAVLRFLSLSPDERGQLEERVRSYAGMMNWDSACKEWVEFYRELLARRNAKSQR